MITVLEYLVIAAAIGAVVFFLAVLAFGRGERMAPLPAQTSPAELPDADITGNDVRDVRFSMALRGYRMSDVDWTLEKLAQRIDQLSGELAAARGESQTVEDAAAAASGSAVFSGSGVVADSDDDVRTDNGGAPSLPADAQVLR